MRPETCARTWCLFSSSTLNIALGNVSTTVAITSIASSFDKLYPDSARDAHPTGHHSLLCQNSSAPGRPRDGVLEMSAQTSILGYRRPAVAQYLHTRLAHIHHGLDGQHHSGAELGSRSSLPVVRNLRIFVHPGPDSVPDKFPHYAEAARFHHFLHRGANISQRRSRPHYFD